MNRVVLLLFLFMPLPVFASHSWSEIDLCKVYEDKLPPGLTADSLPGAPTQGSMLLAQYCTQCHNLPGPDRHSAAEWREVTSKMFMLMDVANRFGGLKGKVEILQPQDQQILLAYLQRYASEQQFSRYPADIESATQIWLTRTLTLLPVLLLTGLGLLRWRRKISSGHKACVID